jgi:spermidine synthase
MSTDHAVESSRAPVFSIALLSGAALGYEIVLMRLFSIIQWHHFAYMVISLALLGYGASGTFLTIFQRGLGRRFTTVYTVNAALFGLSSIGCFLLAQRVPFNPLEILWDTRQPLHLLTLYVLLFVPFFFVANCIGLTLWHCRTQVHRIYAFDLVGAGGGALLVVSLLYLMAPMRALQTLSALSLAATALAFWELRSGRIWLRGAALAAALIPLLLPSGWTALRVSPYKALSEYLQIPQARIVEERSSPLGWLAVVESPRIPFRHAPGLSLNATQEPPEQVGIFTDGDGPSVITRFRGDRKSLAYLDQLTSSLPYHLLERPRTLVLGAGGGADVLEALYHGTPEIDAVELNAQVVDLVRSTYGEFSAHLYERPEVRIHTTEARGFVTASRERYHLIQVALLDSFSASSAGLYALSESYLYTLEALQEYLRHLQPGGMLAITRWMKLPPRDSLKLFATSVAALEDLKVDDVGARLALIRGWRTSTLIIKNGPLSAAQIEQTRAFCAERSFDLAYYPGIRATEANQYNVFEQPYLYRGAQQILGERREAFFDAYKFNIRPATDERPYFFHFFKWRILPEVLAMRGKGGLPLLEWGYLVLVATLLQAGLVGAILILLPLYLRYRWSQPDTVMPGGRVVLYFFAIGLAFLFLEIAFIQRFTLFLHHPTYAIAVVLFGFLLFSGLGSACSGRVLGSGSSPTILIRHAVLAIGVLGLMYLVALAPLFRWLAYLGDSGRIISALALVAPLAFFMGMPFPLGLSLLRGAAPQMIPWAWGINGAASVLSAVLATVLAIHFGFSAVVIAALVLYGLAAFAFHRTPGTMPEPSLSRCPLSECRVRH